jgi:hypothetical protein
MQSAKRRAARPQNEKRPADLHAMAFVVALLGEVTKPNHT